MSSHNPSGMEWSETVPPEKRLEAIRLMHTRSAFPASMGAHKGRYYCVHCTRSVDNFVLYADWPCKTAVFAGARSADSERQP